MIRDKALALVAMHLFVHAANAFGHTVSTIDWLRQSEDVQKSWKERAQVIVQELESLVLAEIESRLEEIAKALWRRSAAGFAAQDDEWEKNMSPSSKQAFREQVRVALSALIAPGRLHA
ncbi:MAG TPA: hypothetical protein VJZ25_07155 [Gemmatimonadaceae bacterium]|nr:hypothetical protein [Gemmatimonadaceae bacterium]